MRSMRAKIIIIILIEVNTLRRFKIIIFTLMIVAVSLIVTGFKLTNSETYKNNGYTYNAQQNDNSNSNNNISMSNSILVNGTLQYRVDSSLLTAVDMAVVPASIYVPPRVEVYDGLTFEELAEKLNRHLGNDYVAGKGEVIAKLCLEKGVDPYIAVAIILHETGCGTKCSNLARNCNNVGGQKGSPSCGNGGFKKFDTLDDGIAGFVDNLSRNYFAMGRTTVETIAPKYCEGNTWAGKINYFVNAIRNG